MHPSTDTSHLDPFSPWTGEFQDHAQERAFLASRWVNDSTLARWVSLGTALLFVAMAWMDIKTIGVGAEFFGLLGVRVVVLLTALAVVWEGSRAERSVDFDAAIVMYATCGALGLTMVRVVRGAQDVLPGASLIGFVVLVVISLTIFPLRFRWHVTSVATLLVIAGVAQSWLVGDVRGVVVSEVFLLAVAFGGLLRVRTSGRERRDVWRLNRSLHRTLRSLHRLFDESPTPMLLLARGSMAVVRTNRALHKMVGLSQFEGDNRFVRSLLDELDPVHEESFTHMELVIRDHRGQAIDVLAACERFREGDEDQLLVALVDIREQKALEGHLQALATIDPLTQALNRRGGESIFQGRCKADTQVCTLLLDLDHFHDVNTRYGHSGGDVALQHVAAVAREVCQEGDLLIRWGGDEFVVVLFEADGERGAEAGRHILEQLRCRPVWHEQAAFRVGLSVGVSEGRGVALDELVTHADEAMYHAKSSGRGQVVQALTPLLAG